MPKGIYVIQSEPASESVETEFNSWYDDVHVPQVCDIPGVMSARRFKVAASSVGDAEFAYLAVYELEADDLEACVAEIGRRAAAGELTFSNTVSMEPRPKALLYALI